MIRALEWRVGIDRAGDGRPGWIERLYCLLGMAIMDSGGTRKRIFPASGLHVPLGQNFIVGVRLHLQYYHSVQPRRLYIGTH